MKKKKTRKFTPDEKYAYHKKRMNDSHISDLQRCYSKNFAYHFSDPNARHNLKFYIDQMNYVKKKNGGRLTGFDSAVYHGSINGYRATLNKNRKISDKQLMKDHSMI